MAQEQGKAKRWRISLSGIFWLIGYICFGLGLLQISNVTGGVPAVPLILGSMGAFLTRISAGKTKVSARQFLIDLFVLTVVWSTLTALMIPAVRS